ncbi:MAG: hypothetical protein GY749_34100 [Desulfobacteraceae bacterium]|nr:hypothetical protein [Desulfobacteraceae bacterium]
MLEQIFREDSRAQQGVHEYIPRSEDGLAVSEEEYWEKYYEHDDIIYEWNNGYLEEKPVSDYQGYLTYDWLYTVLRHYLMVYPIGEKGWACWNSASEWLFPEKQLYENRIWLWY